MAPLALPTPPAPALACLLAAASSARRRCVASRRSCSCRAASASFLAASRRALTSAGMSLGAMSPSAARRCAALRRAFPASRGAPAAPPALPAVAGPALEAGTRLPLPLVRCLLLGLLPAEETVLCALPLEVALTLPEAAFEAPLARGCVGGGVKRGLGGGSGTASGSYSSCLGCRCCCAWAGAFLFRKDKKGTLPDLQWRRQTRCTEPDRDFACGHGRFHSCFIEPDGSLASSRLSCTSFLQQVSMLTRSLPLGYAAMLAAHLYRHVNPSTSC